MTTMPSTTLRFKSADAKWPFAVYNSQHAAATAIQSDRQIDQFFPDITVNTIETVLKCLLNEKPGQRIIYSDSWWEVSSADPNTCILEDSAAAANEAMDANAAAWKGLGLVGDELGYVRINGILAHMKIDWDHFTQKFLKTWSDETGKPVHQLYSSKGSLGTFVYPYILDKAIESCNVVDQETVRSFMSHRWITVGFIESDFHTSVVESTSITGIASIDPGNDQAKAGGNGGGDALGDGTAVSNHISTTDNSNSTNTNHSTANNVEVDPALTNAFAITEVEGGYMLNGKKVRKTEGPPVMVSVYDVMCAITSHHPKDVTHEFKNITGRHPEVLGGIQKLKFPGRGQRDTPVTDARGLVMIMNLLPGRQAAQFRMKAADVLVRYLGGDNDQAKAGSNGGGDTSSTREVTIDPVSPVEAPDGHGVRTAHDANFAITEVEDGYMLNGKKVRKTIGPPVMVSVYDVMCAITGHDSSVASNEFTRLQQRHPEVRASVTNFKFPGRGQRDTPVTDARGLVMIMNLLPGRQAAQFRMKAADVLVRYLGGDRTLISEIQRNASAQDALPEDNIGRLFGDAVAQRSQAIIVASREPPVTLNSVTGFIDMRGPQNYFRLTVSSMWSNVHPCGRPDLIMEPEELAKYAVVKIGCNGKDTGRHPNHELVLKGSKLLDSIPNKCYSYVELRAKDIWRNNNELFEGTYMGKTARDTELLLFKTQAQYNQAVELVQSLVEEAESSGNVQLQFEREKTKRAQADSAARVAEAEVRKLELQIELAKMQAAGSQRD